MSALTEGKWKGGNGAGKKQKSSQRPIAPPPPAKRIICEDVKLPRWLDKYR